MSKASRAITYGVVLLGAAVATYLLSITPSKPKLPRQNNQRTNQLENVVTNSNVVKTNVEVMPVQKRNVFARDHPLYQTNYTRLLSDSNSINSISNFLFSMANLGPKGRLPPWLSSTIDFEKLRAIKYTDFDDTNYGNFIRLSSESISNMRIDNRDGRSVTKVFEVRKGENGEPINVASVENSPFRSSRQKVDVYNDPFEKVAREIFSSQGYNLDQFSSWKRDDWCNNVLVNNFIVATRSYGGKSRAPESMPDLSVTLVTSKEDINTGKVYDNAFCTSYFVVSEFNAQGNLKAPEQISVMPNGTTAVYRAPTNHMGKMSTNYPLPGGRK